MRSLFLNLFCHFELLDMTRLVCVMRCPSFAPLPRSTLRSQHCRCSGVSSLKQTYICSKRLLMSVHQCPGFNSGLSSWSDVGFVVTPQWAPIDAKGAKGVQSDEMLNSFGCFGLSFGMCVCVNNDTPLSSPRSPPQAAETTPFVFSDASHASIPVHTRKTSTPVR